MLPTRRVAAEISDRAFLPEPVERWLDHLQLTTVLSSFASDAGATEGIHGLALLSTSIGNTPLTADTDNSVSLGSRPPEITIEVQNQGDQEESEVNVSFSLTGGVVPLEGEGDDRQARRLGDRGAHPAARGRARHGCAADARGRGVPGARRGGRRQQLGDLHGHLRTRSPASPPCASPTSVPPGPSARTRCDAAGGAELEPVPMATIHDAVVAVERGRRGPGVRPVRELDRGLGAPDARRARVRRAGRGDRR